MDYITASSLYTLASGTFVVAGVGSGRVDIKKAGQCQSRAGIIFFLLQSMWCLLYLSGAVFKASFSLPLFSLASLALAVNSLAVVVCLVRFFYPVQSTIGREDVDQSDV